ncbi:MAG: UDP-3-O-acyl-N-acetylglucosamine deacetylase, partial [Alphaproteobacteria bacterium]
MASETTMTGPENEMAVQHTLAAPLVLEGIGLHQGTPVILALKPAAADHGIVFVRSDLDAPLNERTIPARYDHVSDTMMCTTISNKYGASVATIEHLMAAIAGLGIDNLLIEVDAPEMPVMDGSSEIFLGELMKIGLEAQDAPRKALRIVKPVQLVDGAKEAALLPGDGFAMDVSIDFDNKVIGRQSASLSLANGAFRKHLGKARTFGFLKDVEALKQLGLGLGGSLENAIVIDGDEVMNEDGLRFDDEFVRHKALDAVGDLALAGLPILGTFKGVRPGHDMNNRILRALFASPDAFEVVTLSAAEAAKLPSAA